MSSTGRVYRGSAPTTVMHEGSRQTGQANLGSPGPQDQLRRDIGIISRTHPQQPRLIQAYSEQDYTPLANGQWIVLNHSAQEIAERWGTVRTGFRVRITFSGPAAGSADATIIGAEGQTTHETAVPNEIARGLFAIFAPGIGVG